MAQTGFSKILTYKSDTATTVPAAGDLTNGAGGAELAVNTADKRLFTKDSGGNVVELGTNPSSITLPNGTANGVVYANGSKVLTTGSALTFDGTTFGVTNSSAGSSPFAATKSADGIVAFFRRLGGTYNTGMTLSFADTTANEVTFNTLYSTGSNPSYVWQNGGSEKMRLTDTGLGIGTSSPGEKLTVNGYVGFQNSGSQKWHVGADSSSNLSFVRSSVAERMVLTSDGNLGLGVTTSAWTANSKAMQIGSLTSIYNDAYNAATVVGFNQYHDTDTTEKYLVTGVTASKFVQKSGQHQWYTAPSGTAGNPISFTQAMTLDASGNLGIGNTVAGTINSNNGSGTLVVGSGSGSQGMTIYSGSTSGNEARLTFANASSGAGSYSAQVTFKSGDNAILFYNQNAERMRIDSSGNVGIGTSSPANKLDVVGGSGRILVKSTNTAANADIRYTATNADWVVGVNSVSGTGEFTWYNVAAVAERMRLDSSGNLGLGVTPSAWQTTSYKVMELGWGTSLLGQTDTGNTILGTNYYLNSSYQYIYKNTGVAARYNQYNGQHQWFTAPSGTAGDAISFTQAMTLDTNYNLTLNAGGGYQTTKGGIYPEGAGQIFYSNGYCRFSNNSSETMRIDSSGNVGIGTSSPGTTLDVAGNARSNAWIGRANGSAPTADCAVFRPADGTLGFSTGNTERMRIDSSGNVGIGTSSPSATLDITRATQGSFSTFRAFGPAGQILWANDGASTSYLDSDTIIFRNSNSSGNAERMRIDSSGNLLVGTTSTLGSGRLQVRGGIIGDISSGDANLSIEARSGGTLYSLSIYNSTTAAGASVTITGSAGYLQRSTSSAKYKTEVEDLEPNRSEELYSLRPVWYRSLCKTDRKDWSWYGLIAEEVAEIDPRLVHWGAPNKDGIQEAEGVMYERITVFLIAEMKKIKAELDATKAEVAALKGA